MAGERVQRQIDRLLDEAEQALAARDWARVRGCAEDVLRLDPTNSDALAFLAAAERDPAAVPPVAAAPATRPWQPAEAPASASPEPAPDHPRSVAGGRYAVRRFLGEGGKKRVYLAHDTLLDRDVALALLKTEGMDDAGRARLRREAQAMGRLGSHPHIVSVLDLGDEAGRPYIATEFLPGGDLEVALATAPDHRLPLERVLEAGRQVCRALAFAHGHRIVHRDLKPGNVWLTADGTAKLGDFGLAMALDRSRLTQAGMMVGTVSYMPPEQALGGEVTPRSDLYALGALLYELVTGRPPFVGDEAVAIITQHLHTAPVAPTWHRPDCPPALEALVLRLLEKDPAKRPASAAEVEQALAAVSLAPARMPEAAEAGGSPAEADTTSPVYRRAFVGREAELGALKAAFDGALSGQGALVMVVGEPGIGKTALTEQLATYAAVRGGRVLVGHCYEEGSLSLPYLPFVEALRSYVLDRDSERLRAELGSGAGEVARIVSEVRERLAVEPSAATDPEEDRYRLLQAVTGFLRHAAAVQPLVLVLEDLHDADQGTLDLLKHLTRNLQGARLLVAGTYRDVEVDRTHPLSAALAELRRGGGFSRVLLRGLGADEVQRMLAVIAGQAVPWGLAEAVHRQTEGNPLFVQEVVRYLVEEGLIKREGGRWRAASSETPLAQHIPEGLRDVIGRRLGRLSSVCNRLLAVAAVIGRDFALDTLRAVVELEEEALLGALEEAVRVAVLEERERPGAIWYRFTHAFFRQALYEELIAPRRLRLHQQVARALEGQYTTRLAEHATELAEHFAHSTDAADLEKAVHYGELAARRAMAVYAYGEAVRLLEQALGVQEVLDPDDKARRCDLLLALGEALMPAGDPRRVAEEAAPAALALAEALGDEQRAASACRIAITALLRYAGGGVITTPAYRRWTELADRYAPLRSIDRVHADVAVADVEIFDGRYYDGRQRQRRALALARDLGDADTLFFAAQQLLNFGPPPRDWDEPVKLAEEFTQRPRHGVSERQVGRMLWRSGEVFLGVGNRARTEAVWRELDALAERTRDTNVLLFPYANEADLATIDGRLEAAAEVVPRLLARAEELGSPGLGMQLAQLATRRALLYLGRAEEEVALTREWARITGVEDVWWLVLSTALSLAHLGRTAEAGSMLRRAMADWGVDRTADTAGQQSLDTLALLLEVAVLTGDAEAADVLASSLAGTGHLATFCSTMVCIARLLGAAAALTGDRSAAHAAYQQALDVAGKLRYRPELALTRLQIAELLGAPNPPAPFPPARRGRHAREGGQASVAAREEEGDRREEIRKALEHLAFCIPEFEAMKMQPALECALRLRERLAEARSAATGPAPHSALRTPHSAPAFSAERLLVAVLFTDIVGSTERAAELGDRAWRRLKAQHHARVRRELERYRGHEVDTAGDGFFVTFDAPARAVRCACAIRDAVRALGLEIRAGLHLGEVELQDGTVSGLTVHVGARVAALAGRGEVLVTQTVRDLVAGSELRFAERGTHTLKGVPGEWPLFAVDIGG